MAASNPEMSMHDFVDQLAGAMGHAGTLENLVRPLLELLQTVAGLESTVMVRVIACLAPAVDVCKACCAMTIS